MLPFADALFDQALVVHALEHAATAERVLRELWRVLAPGGSIVMVVPNRAGIWVHMETTPFGHGAPLGKNQLRRMLADALFEVDHRQPLLAAPTPRPFGWTARPLLQLTPRTRGLHDLHAVTREG